MRILILLFIFGLLFYSSAVGQKLLKLQILHEQISADTIQVYALNQEKEAHSVVANYKELNGLKASVDLPYFTTMEPGKTSLFTLVITGSTDEPSYTPLFQFRIGPLKTMFPDFEYSLPISTLKETLLYSNIDTAGLGPDQDYREYIYLLVMNVISSDTLIAARSGKVVNIEDVSARYGSKVKEPLFSMEIEHADGSIAHYFNISPNNMAKEKDYVKVGDPIGLGPERGKLTFYVRDKVYVPRVNGFSNDYLFIKFKIDENDPVMILDSAGYMGYITEDMITREMSKKERRRYFRKKKD